MSAVTDSIPQTLFNKSDTRTSRRAALALRTPRWRQPRFNGLALTLLIGGGALLILLL